MATTSCTTRENQSIKNKDKTVAESDSTQSIIDINYDILDITTSIDFKSFDYQTETYKVMDSTFKVNHYFKDSSFVKTFDNRHPRVLNLDLVCGLIKSNNHITTNPIIGIAKNNFFSKYPQLKRIQSKNSVTIYQDELGGFWTTYEFKSDTLHSIILSSDYDWVNCK